MSHASQIRRVRKLKRGIGKKRMTRHQMLDEVAARVMKQVIKLVGRENVKFQQFNAFSYTIESASNEVERVLLDNGYIRTAAGEFVHKKMRLSDFVGIGAMVSLVSRDPHPLPDVSDEAVERIRKLMCSTEAVRFDTL